MAPGPLILLVPSRAAGVEIPRRLASSGRALAGLYPLTLADLASAVADARCREQLDVDKESF